MVKEPWPSLKNNLKIKEVIWQWILYQKILFLVGRQLPTKQKGQPRPMVRGQLPGISIWKIITGTRLSLRAISTISTQLICSWLRSLGLMVFGFPLPGPESSRLVMVRSIPRGWTSTTSSSPNVTSAMLSPLWPSTTLIRQLPSMLMVTSSIEKTSIISLTMQPFVSRNFQRSTIGRPSTKLVPLAMASIWWVNSLQVSNTIWPRSSNLITIWCWPTPVLSNFSRMLAIQEKLA